MARATWKGVLSFGLVSIPVSLFSGEKKAELQFEMVDVRDQARIRYRRVNEETGEEVPWDQIVRAYEYADGNYILLQEADFERADMEANKTITVDTFIDSGTIDPVFYEKPYIMVPSKGGEKAYVLLREALRGTGKMGIGKYVHRGKQYLVALMPHGDAIIANRLRFAQEVIDPAQFDLPAEPLRAYGVTAEELDMAERLVSALSGEWQPEKYHDEYREAMLNWIDKKVRVGELVPQPAEETEPEPAEPINITELLRQSLEQARGR